MWKEISSLSYFAVRSTGRSTNEERRPGLPPVVPVQDHNTGLTAGMKKHMV